MSIPTSKSPIDSGRKTHHASSHSTQHSFLPSALCLILVGLVSLPRLTTASDLDLDADTSAWARPELQKPVCLSLPTPAEPDATNTLVRELEERYIKSSYLLSDDLALTRTSRGGRHERRADFDDRSVLAPTVTLTTTERYTVTSTTTMTELRIETLAARSIDGELADEEVNGSTPPSPLPTPDLHLPCMEANPDMKPKHPNCMTYRPIHVKRDAATNGQDEFIVAAAAAAATASSSAVAAAMTPLVQQVVLGSEGLTTMATITTSTSTSTSTMAMTRATRTGLIPTVSSVAVDTMTVAREGQEGHDSDGHEPNRWSFVFCVWGIVAGMIAVTLIRAVTQCMKDEAREKEEAAVMGQQYC